MVAPDVHWLTLLPPQTHCALSVARADCAGCVPVAVLTPALLQMSSDLLGAEGDHQHPRVQTLAAEIPVMQEPPVERCHLTQGCPVPRGKGPYEMVRKKSLMVTQELWLKNAQPLGALPRIWNKAICCETGKELLEFCPRITEAGSGLSLRRVWRVLPQVAFPVMRSTCLSFLQVFLCQLFHCSGQRCLKVFRLVTVVVLVSPQSV